MMERRGEEAILSPGLELCLSGGGVVLGIPQR